MTNYMTVNEAEIPDDNMDKDWLEWIAHTMANRPKRNHYLESERGIEIGKLALDEERKMFSWRRSDPDTFWIDVQLFTKYKLTDKQILFIMRMQPGVEQYKIHAEERKAFAEMMRGFNKLKTKILAEVEK